MTEISRPWSGRSPGDPGDAGSYTMANWWDVWAALKRGGGARMQTAFADYGVFYAGLGRLAGTSPGVNTVTISQGLALVDGLFYDNDDDEDITVASATAGNVRDDRIVIRKTFGVTTQTARLTLLTGTEAAAPGPGTPPAITQDTARLTYWDIPLWRVSITDAGVITLTDERTYVDAGTIRRFIPALGGYNITDAVDYPYAINTSGAGIPGVDLVDNKLCQAFGWYVVPENYISDMVFTAVVHSASSGNLRLSAQGHEVDYGACTEPVTTHFDRVASQEVAIGADDYNCVAPLTPTSMALLDMMLLIFSRDGTHVNDTLGDLAKMLGWYVEYFGYKSPM